MALASIHFGNLRAEMARGNISIKEIADSVGMTRDTLRNKLKRKTPLSLDEAYAINRIFFPDQDIRYLFSEAFNVETDEKNIPASKDTA